MNLPCGDGKADEREWVACLLHDRDCFSDDGFLVAGS